MTDWERIVTTIEDDPARFEKYTDELHGILESGDTEARRAVAELLWEVSDHDSAIVAAHTELLETALQDSDAAVCESALDTVVRITEKEQVRIPSLGEALVSGLETVHEAPTEIFAYWALAAISNNTPKIVRECDELFAVMFDECGKLTRQMIALNMAAHVVDQPDAFPKMLRAYIDGLSDINSNVRLAAAETLAAVARKDADVISDIEMVITKMKHLRNHSDLDSETISQAIRTVQQAANDDTV